MTDIEILSTEVLNGLIEKGFVWNSNKFDDVLTKEIRDLVEVLKAQPDLDDENKKTILNVLKKFISLSVEAVQEIKGDNLIERLDSFILTNTQNEEQNEAQAALLAYKAVTKKSSQTTPQKPYVETPQTPLDLSIGRVLSPGSIKKRKAKKSPTLNLEDQRLAAKVKYNITVEQYALLREKINSAPQAFINYVVSIFVQVAKNIEEEIVGDSKGQVCIDSYIKLEKQLADLNSAMQSFIDFDVANKKISEKKHESSERLAAAIQAKLASIDEKVSKALTELQSHKVDRFKIEDIYSEVKKELNTLLEQYFYFKENKPELEKQAGNLNSRYIKLLEFFGKKQTNLIIFDDLFSPPKDFQWNIRAVEYNFGQGKQEVEKLNQDMQEKRKVLNDDINEVKKACEVDFKKLLSIKTELLTIKEKLDPFDDFYSPVSNLLKRIDQVETDFTKDYLTFSKQSELKAHLEFLQNLSNEVSQLEQDASVIAKKVEAHFLQLNHQEAERAKIEAKRKEKMEAARQAQEAIDCDQVFQYVFDGLGDEAGLLDNQNHKEQIKIIANILGKNIQTDAIPIAAVYLAHLKNNAVGAVSELSDEDYVKQLHENYELQISIVEQIKEKVDGYIKEEKHGQDKKDAFDALKPNLDDEKLIANPKQKIINHQNAIKPENNKMNDVYTEHRIWFVRFIRFFSKNLALSVQTKFFSEPPKSQAVAEETLNLAEQAVPPTAAVG